MVFALIHYIESLFVQAAALACVARSLETRFRRLTCIIKFSSIQ